MEKTTICVINQKGGSGKSSTCFHLSQSFAVRGLRVLLVDADPQGSLSQGFFGSSGVEQTPRDSTLAAIFDDTHFVSKPNDLVVATPFENISIVRANSHLASHNTPVPEQTGMRQFALRSFLEELTGFNLVMIDCPPNLYQCSWNAMLASDSVLIPVPPEDFGTQGLRTVHQAIERAQQLNAGLRLLGQVITRYDRRLNVHRSYAAKLRQIYGSDVLTEMVPEASAFKVALACRKPVISFSPRSAASHSTIRLTDELLARMNNTQYRHRVA